MNKPTILHICTQPVWEHDYYWETLNILSKVKEIDLSNLPIMLRKYPLKDIKRALRYAEEHDKCCKRINRNTWKWSG